MIEQILFDGFPSPQPSPIEHVPVCGEPVMLGMGKHGFSGDYIGELIPIHNSWADGCDCDQCEPLNEEEGKLSNEEWRALHS